MEQIQQLKEQIKLLEQQELEKKIKKEENDIEYILGVLNKMISERIKKSECRFSNKYLENYDGRANSGRGYFSHSNLQFNGMQLNYILLKMLNIIVLMNKEISELKT